MTLRGCSGSQPQTAQELRRIHSRQCGTEKAGNNSVKTPLAATFPSFRDSIRNAADIDATIDFKASFDSLEIMEGVTRHFFLRALIEESMGSQTDSNAVDSLMLKALAAAEKVARYRHAQLSAIKLAGDITPR